MEDESLNLPWNVKSFRCHWQRFIQTWQKTLFWFDIVLTCFWQSSFCAVYQIYNENCFCNFSVTGGFTSLFFKRELDWSVWKDVACQNVSGAGLFYASVAFIVCCIGQLPKEYYNVFWSQSLFFAKDDSLQGFFTNKHQRFKDIKVKIIKV